MKKGYIGKVKSMNLHEQYINDLFDKIDYDELTEEECIPVINALTLLEKPLLDLLKSQGIDEKPYSSVAEKSMLNMSYNE